MIKRPDNGFSEERLLTRGDRENGVINVKNSERVNENAAQVSTRQMDDATQINVT